MFSLDCHHHVRNVWIDNSNTIVADFLRPELDFDSIKSQSHRVSANYLELLHSVSKCFCTDGKYEKGYGTAFKAWANKHYHNEFIFPIQRSTTGSRQDETMMGAPAIYLN